MERSEWLTEARIKGYFSKLAASQRFNTNNPSLDQIEDSCSMLDMCQKTQEAIDVARNQEHTETMGQITYKAFGKKFQKPGAVITAQTFL